MDSNLKSNLKTQLDELETLQSMFCNPGEVRIEDALVPTQINEFIQGNSTDIPPFLDLIINISIDDEKFELCVNLSNEYPSNEPDVYVRNHKLSKKDHAAINRDLTEFLTNLERGTPCIFTAISWLQDNAVKYRTVTDDTNVVIASITGAGETETLVRYWIYSHHIYSKTKRREILNLAGNLDITGFCMPGKPGIICIEGKSKECSEWWQLIKSMNWKRIFCKIVEDCTEDESKFRKFHKFEEIVFQNNSIKCNHMDMGELYRFLEDHECGYVFKEIFGVETKS